MLGETELRQTATTNPIAPVKNLQNGSTLMRSSAGPTLSLRRGDLDEPIYVLSLPDIRDAEILTEQTGYDTADGHVIGRPGDIVVTAYGGERYPIQSNVFYGTYEVIGQVGQKLVARRMVHVRRAWQITSPDAEFDYGDTRGVVAVARGGWLYQSDDADFGLVNPIVNQQGHAVVGAIGEIDNVQWQERFDIASTTLVFLPPVLTLFALLALVTTLNHQEPWVPITLLAIETMLLLGGVFGVWWMRHTRWAMKAHMRTGISIARAFQPAVKLLGQRTSADFPQMALWRAGQASVPAHPQDADYSLMSEVGAQLGQTLEELRSEVEHNHRNELFASVGAVIAVVTVVASNLWLTFISHLASLELLAIWLPALIGAFHVWNYRRRGNQRLSLLLETIPQLRFIQQRLLSLSLPQQPHNDDQSASRRAALQLLCRVIGHYCQQEVRFALAQEPHLPV